MKKKYCKECGKEFYAYSGSKTVRCASCIDERRKKREEKRFCKGCGEVLTKEQVIGKRKYCSRECAGKYSEKHINSRVEKICKSCGNLFVTTKGSQYVRCRKCIDEHKKMCEERPTHCKKCGKKLTPKQINNHNVYCGRECAELKPIVKKVCICQVCGVEFKRTHRDRTGLYCSKQCAILLRWEVFHEENPQVKKNQEIVKLIKVLNRFEECVYCNQKFVIKSSSAVGGKCRRTYCYDDACIKQHASIKVREWAERNHNENIKPIECGWCGKTYFREYGKKNTVYCSVDCKEKHDNSYWGHGFSNSHLDLIRVFRESQGRC